MTALQLAKRSRSNQRTDLPDAAIDTAYRAHNVTFPHDAAVSCGRRQSGAYCADPGDRIVYRYRHYAGWAVRDGVEKIAEGIDMDEFSARRLNDVIGVLTEQRNIVVGKGAIFAGHLIDLAIVQLRMTLHDISEEELSEFSNLLSVNRGRGREHSD